MDQPLPLSPEDNPKASKARGGQEPKSKDEELSQVSPGNNEYWLVFKNDEQPETGVPIVMKGDLNHTQWLAQLNMSADQKMWYEKRGAVLVVDDEDQYDRMVLHALDVREIVVMVGSELTDFQSPK